MKRLNNLRTWLLFICLFILIFDSKTAVIGGKEGITICIDAIIPSLFPFLFIMSLIKGNLSDSTGFPLSLAARILGYPSGSEALMIPCILGGYPLGASAAAQLYRDGQLRKEEAEKLLYFCSNAGPAFLFGVLGHHFPDKTSVFVIWLIQLTAASMVSVLFPMDNNMHLNLKSKSTDITKCLEDAIRGIANICGWVLLFRILVAFLQRWVLWRFSPELQMLTVGILELSNGCSMLEEAAMPMRFILACGMLSFGGLCVLMQTVSVVSPLDIKPYVIGKCLQTVFSILLAFAWCSRSPLLFLLPIAMSAIRYFKKTCGNLQLKRV